MDHSSGAGQGKPAAFWSMLLCWGVMLAMQFGLIPTPGKIGPPLWGLFTGAIVLFGLSLAVNNPVETSRRKRFQGDVAERFPETRSALTIS